MRVGGVTVTAPVEELLVIPRGDTNLVFIAKALDNMDEFDALSPKPEPPGKFTKDGWVPEPDHPDYRTILEHYGIRRLAYIVVRSLEPSNIEWDTVDISNPKTWVNWETDLRNAKMTGIEIDKVLQLVIETNSLSEAKLKKARESFLLGQALATAESSGRQIEPTITQSGEPATASV